MQTMTLVCAGSSKLGVFVCCKPAIMLAYIVFGTCACILLNAFH